MALENINRLPFSADTVLIRAGGQLGRRANAALSVGYSGGQSGAIGETGRFSNYTAAAEFGFTMSRAVRPSSVTRSTTTIWPISWWTLRLRCPAISRGARCAGGMTIRLAASGIASRVARATQSRTELTMLPGRRSALISCSRFSAAGCGG